MKRKIALSLVSVLVILVILICLFHFNIMSRFSKQTKDELIDSGYSAVLPVFNSSTNLFSYSIDNNMKYKVTINLFSLKGKADCFVLKSDFDKCFNEEQLVTKMENDSKDIELVDGFSIDKEGKKELDFCDYAEGKYYLLIKCEDDTLDGQVVENCYYTRGYKEYCKIKDYYLNMTDEILKINGIPYDSYKKTWDWDNEN